MNFNKSLHYKRRYTYVCTTVQYIWTCMYVCMCLCVRACICMYGFVYVCKCLCVSVNVYLCLYMRNYVYVCMNVCMYVWVYVHLCMYECVYVCMCLCAFMYVFMCICECVLVFLHAYVCVCMYECIVTGFCNAALHDSGATSFWNVFMNILSVSFANSRNIFVTSFMTSKVTNSFCSFVCLQHLHPLPTAVFLPLRTRSVTTTAAGSYWVLLG